LSAYHLDVVYAGPAWTLDEAAAAMVRGGFRHLVVFDGDDVLGIISVRDIVGAWSQSAATANSAPSRDGDAAH
jgi:signal-transduction protein with cAMP-binding, CBS, and nucleotidyltransferase domain